MPSEAPLPRGEEKRQAVRQMFDDISDRYEKVNTVVSFGLDRRWRRTCLSSLALLPASLVLDVACGTADLCRDLIRQGMRPIGLDLSIGMLNRARTAAPLVLGDALGAPFPDACFDGAVSGFALRNVVDLGALFEELARLVKPGGRISLLDMSRPENPLLRIGHEFWVSRAVPLIGSALSDRDAYNYLPRSLAYLPAPSVTIGLLERAGFHAVERRLLTGGTVQIFTATRVSR